MSSDSRAILGIVAIIVLILIALNLLKKKTIGASSVRVLGDTGQEIMQDCTYSDGSVLRQPTRWGPCPPMYNGANLVSGSGQQPCLDRNGNPVLYPAGTPCPEY